MQVTGDGSYLAQPGMLAGLRRQEQAYRSVGHYRVADSARRLGDLIEAGRDEIFECEWFDRGASEMPNVEQFHVGGRIKIRLNEISIGLAPDQMLRLWVQLTVCLFERQDDAHSALLDLLSCGIWGGDDGNQIRDEQVT